MRTGSASSCPYAVALHNDTDSESDDHHSAATSEDDQLKLLKSCPAFADKGTCPFANAKSANDVRKTLMNVPPSHYQDNSTAFYKVIQDIHLVVGKQDDNEQFALPGGCPIPSQLRSSVRGADALKKEPALLFTSAMEEFSLASIMARMAQEVMEEEGLGDSGTTSAVHLEEEKAAKEPPSSLVAAKPAPITETQPTSSLSACLKTGTADSHKAAESVHFVRNFVRRKIDRKLFARMTAMLYYVYETMEECLDEKAAIGGFESCHFPTELARKEALRDDLDFWYGHVPELVEATTSSVDCFNDSAKNTVLNSPATRDYLNRLRDIAKRNPVLLLAHAYTRYLGDLSGGIVLKKVALNALNLKPKGAPSNATGVDGLRFYDFENMKEKPKEFKERYRQCMDDLPLSKETIQALVQEANVAFCLNMRLFEELDVVSGIVPGASVRPLEDALQYGNVIPESPAPAKTTEKCPFANLNKQAQAEKCPFASPTGAVGKPVAKATSGRSVQGGGGGGGCPWPFVLLHDPVRGMRDFWQSWALVGLLACWIWSQVVTTTASA